MNVVLNILVGVQMLTALAMIGLILVQHGKGADMGAAFGSGSAGSLFGASGSANFLSRTTAVLAAVFFACTLAAGLLRPCAPGGRRQPARARRGRRAVRRPRRPAPADSAAQIPAGSAAPAPAQRTGLGTGCAGVRRGQIPAK